MPDVSGGPAVPTPAATSALRPLGAGDVQLDPNGLLGGWQWRNATATLPHCIARIEDSGPVANMRRAAGEGHGEHQGLWFSDSDIYKTMEAAAWELGRRPGDRERRLGRGVGWTEEQRRREERAPSSARRKPTPSAAEPERAIEHRSLVEFLGGVTPLLAKAQGADGYLNSYYQTGSPERRWQELPSSHEHYCAGHLIQAAVAAARGEVASDLVTIARRFADLLVDHFGPGGVDGIDGHPEIETALVELYRVTGHRPYLDLAEKFVNLRGRGLLGADRFGPRYYQDHQPVRETTEVTGHAVRQLYLLAGVVDVAVETGDDTLLAAAERLWDSAFGTKTYLTGAHGSRHRDEAFGDPYELPPDRAYAETCAAIASFQWNWRLLLATGGHRYAEEMERVLYNAIAVSSSVDGQHYFYANPLQVRTGHDGSDEHTTAQRLAWYSCPCCPPNLARLLATLHCYLATTSADGLRLHLYAPSTIRALVHDSEVGIRVRTEYPWQGRIELTVTGGPARPWPLALRIPAWCGDFTVTVDGEPVDIEAERGYVRLTRAWPASGTSVVLDLDMPARLVTAHPLVDAVRGCVALTRGPLVFCLEQTDLPDGTAVEEIRLDTTKPVRVVDRADLPHIPVTLATDATVLDSTAPALYREHSPTRPVPARTVPITAVPYFLWGNRKPGAMRVWIPLAT